MADEEVIIRTLSTIVCRKSEGILDECGIIISVENEGDGDFISLAPACQEKLTFNPEEWPILKKAIDSLLTEVAAYAEEDTLEPLPSVVDLTVALDSRGQQVPKAFDERNQPLPKPGPKRLTCTLKDLSNAVDKWVSGAPSQRSNCVRGFVIKRDGLRLSQYIWNRFGIGQGSHWPEFFYCEDPNETERIAREEVNKSVATNQSIL